MLSSVHPIMHADGAGRCGDGWVRWGPLVRGVVFAICVRVLAIDVFTAFVVGTLYGGTARLTHLHKLP